MNHELQTNRLITEKLWGMQRRQAYFVVYRPDKIMANSEMKQVGTVRNQWWDGRNCHCIAEPVNGASTYAPPPNDDFQKATND